MQSIIKIAKVVVMGLIFGVLSVYGYVLTHLPKKRITDREVREIYRQIITQTGQSQDALPLVIDNQPIVNAYTDGKDVHIYRGMLNYVENKDELALVLGHEVAHDMLRHVYFNEFGITELETTVAEANADKMGALYLMKAGYNICKAREMWKRMKTEQGDFLGADHPNMAYRYDELNIGCE